MSDSRPFTRIEALRDAILDVLDDVSCAEDGPCPFCKAVDALNELVSLASAAPSRPGASQ